jgi:hypothetical protein
MIARRKRRSAMGQNDELYQEVADLIGKAREAGCDVDSQAEWHDRTGSGDQLNMLKGLREELRAMLQKSAT